ncbi:hypothetical protein [Beijerinckia sp. L45]|uniref:hypothetical protein n=1 Tax=Beijerinckia sp. L45 TaxID=1641855 RepID=UPI00131E3CE7|nr:hypothetical protein [Beijerinckia sp. L45]
MVRDLCATANDDTDVAENFAGVELQVDALIEKTLLDLSESGTLEEMEPSCSGAAS